MEAILSRSQKFDKNPPIKGPENSPNEIEAENIAEAKLLHYLTEFGYNSIKDSFN